jgi:hypothetical protein
LWPTRAIVRRRFKGALALEKRELWTYRASRISAWAVLAVLVGWVVALQALFNDLGNGASFNTILLLLEILSLVVFLGALAVAIWYAYGVWKRPGGWRATWAAKTWSVFLVIAMATIVYVGLVFKLIGLTTNF